MTTSTPTPEALSTASTLCASRSTHQSLESILPLTGTWKEKLVMSTPLSQFTLSMKFKPSKKNPDADEQIRTLLERVFIKLKASKSDTMPSDMGLLLPHAGNKNTNRFKKLAAANTRIRTLLSNNGLNSSPSPASTTLDDDDILSTELTLDMSKLGSLKKPELLAIATDLGLATDGVKSDLENRIATFFAENPSSALSNPKYAGYVATSSPIKARRRSIKPTSKAGSAGSDTVKHSPEVDDATSAANTSFVSDLVGNTSLAKIYASVSDNTVVDDSKKFLSSKLKCIKSFNKTFGTKFHRASNTARSGLSSVVFISYFFTIVEFVLLLSTIVPISSKPIVGYVFPLPHFEIVTYWKTFWLPLILWLSGSVLLPIVLSYYINFTGASQGRRKSAKSFEFDPFVYAGVRFIVGYLLYPRIAVQLASWKHIGRSYEVVGKALPIVNTAVKNYSFFAGVISLAVITYAAIY